MVCAMTMQVRAGEVVRTMHDARLLWPARLSLAFGAAAATAIVLRGPKPPGDNPEAGIVTLLLVSAGVPACIWLVRVQKALIESRAPLKYDYPPSGLWVMWAVPILSAVLPAARLARFDAAARRLARPDGPPDRLAHRLWQVVPWSIALQAMYWLSRGAHVGPVAVWLLAVATVVAYALWVYIVERLTRVTLAAAAKAAHA